MRDTREEVESTKFRFPPSRRESQAQFSLRVRQPSRLDQHRALPLKVTELLWYFLSEKKSRKFIQVLVRDSKLLVCYY